MYVSGVCPKRVGSTELNAGHAGYDSVVTHAGTMYVDATAEELSQEKSKEKCYQQKLNLNEI